MAESIQVLHNIDTSKGVFYVSLNAKRMAEMTYTWAGSDKIIIDHTFVDEQLKGQKIGCLMLAEAVAFAREKQIKILPLCPFAKYAMQKNSKYQDVIF